MHLHWFIISVYNLNIYENIQSFSEVKSHKWFPFKNGNYSYIFIFVYLIMTQNQIK